MRITLGLALLSTAALAIIPSVVSGCIVIEAGDFEPRASIEDIHHLFEAYGRVEAIIFRLNPEDDGSTMIARVTYHGGVDGDRAIYALDGAEVKGRRMWASASNAVPHSEISIEDSAEE